jgi:hypothetical protein
MIVGFVLSPISWVAYFVLYFLAVKNYRDELGGFISFGKGYKVSLFSVLVKAVVVFIWGIIFYFLVVPNYCTDMLNLLENSIPQNMTSNNNDVVSMYSMMYNPFSLILMVL